MRDIVLMAAAFVAMAIMLVMSCMRPSLDDQQDLAGSAHRVDLAGRDAGEGSNMGERGGGLPPGYYNRGCQWDACEPAPNSGQPAAQPQR